jgi:hypothetical protein
MHLKLVTDTHESSSYQVFLSFYEEMRSEFSISIKAKNLFLSLAESIAQILNVTSCYVCGGTSMGEHWPWEVRELDPQEPFFLIYFLFFIIHMCIQCLDHFSPCPHPLPYHPLPPLSPPNPLDTRQKLYCPYFVEERV